MEQERVRIIDIAEELGVSTTTVSNVIHGKTKRTSEETIKRVQELLEKKAYIPSMAGILLAQNDSRIVGIIVHDHEKYEHRALEDGFVAAALNALSAELDRAGYFMMVKVTADCNEIVRIASMWNMEGLVLLGFCEQDYKKLRESMHIPFVVYDGYFSEKTDKICNLVIDNFDGGYQAGAYLKRCGHTKVLCIADNYGHMDKERIEGCGAGMKEYGADFLQIPLIQKDRRRFYRENLPLITTYTAVFVVSDFYAMELIHDLEELGICVPEDISVIGFDDSLLCAKITPALTTIHQDPAERARKAVDALQKLKKGTCEETTVMLPVALVERESVKVL